VQRDDDWLREAQAELAAARALRDAGHWSWCCFTAQQSAEKALKAACERLRIPHFGRNLNVLVQPIDEREPVPERVKLACGRLNRYYIPTRYPDAFDQGAPADQFFDTDAEQAIEDADAVAGFAQRVGGPS